VKLPYLIRPYFNFDGLLTFSVEDPECPLPFKTYEYAKQYADYRWSRKNG